MSVLSACKMSWENKYKTFKHNTRMKSVIILRGLPASGKSTWAKNLIKEKPGSYKRVNRDDLRAMLDAAHYSKGNEKFVRNLRDHIIREALAAGKHVIVDDTNLQDATVERIKKVVNDYCAETGEQVEVKMQEFEPDLELSIARDAQREKPVGEKVIRKMQEQMTRQQQHRDPDYHKQDESLPPAIIVDLDGTLALLNGRHPFDASTCDEDLVNEPIRQIVETYHTLGTKVILLSGRQDAHEEPTRRWLAKHEIPFDALYMRKAKDQRKDAIIKKELYEANIKEQYFIRFVLDDRNQVVDLWRQELGLPCLQVYYGDF